MKEEVFQPEGGLEEAQVFAEKLYDVMINHLADRSHNHKDGIILQI
ncbi:MAG: hypothetical protein ACPIB5_06020 [Flavobacteriaceae bacterium]